MSVVVSVVVSVVRPSCVRRELLAFSSIFCSVRRAVVLLSTLFCSAIGVQVQIGAETTLRRGVDTCGGHVRVFKVPWRTA